MHGPANPKVTLLCLFVCLFVCLFLFLFCFMLYKASGFHSRYCSDDKLVDCDTMQLHILTPVLLLACPVCPFWGSYWPHSLQPACIITILCHLNPLKPELNPICYLLALLAHHFPHVSRIRVKSLTFRLLMSYIYGAPILDVSRSHTTTQHSR